MQRAVSPYFRRLEKGCGLSFLVFNLKLVSRKTLLIELIFVFGVLHGWTLNHAFPSASVTSSL